jgi:hypothetical protein
MTGTAVGRTGRQGEAEAAFRLSLAAIAAQAAGAAVPMFPPASNAYFLAAPPAGR